MWKLWRTTESEPLKAKIGDIEQKLREFEGRLKEVESEWAVHYVKMKRIMGNITKSAGIDRKREEEESNDDSNSNSNSRIVGVHATLQAMRSKHGLLPR